MPREWIYVLIVNCGGPPGRSEGGGEATCSRGKILSLYVVAGTWNGRSPSAYELVSGQRAEEEEEVGVEFGSEWRWNGGW